MEVDPLLTSIFTLNPHDIQCLLSVSEKKANQIYRQLQQSDQIYEQIKADEKNVTIITIIDSIYPDILRHIPDPPLVLYAIGNIQLLKAPRLLSVIGTRKPSHEAREKLHYVITPLIEMNYVIVSGLAYGIDSFAHEQTLHCHGKTIAILGGGFKHIYPKEHLALCRKIAKHGLVLSEYAPDTRPKKYHFPERNRIISGVSQRTLVVEATERSGTLITVDQALEQGKDVFAIPGSPLLQQTVGCHQMIQEGAKLVMCAKDIYEEWG